MPIRLSYINARNEEVVLDDDEHSFAGELAGRTGFEMPQIETKTVTYGDGTQDIIYSKMKTRTVTCYFWVDLDNKVEFERRLNEVKAKILQVGSRMGDWGKLKIRQKNGEYRYLNCIYKGGFDGITRDSNVRLKFSLSFEATDPIFYNTYESKYIIQTPKNASFLYMKPLLFNGKKRSPTNYNFKKDNATDNPNGLYMHSRTQPRFNWDEVKQGLNPEGLMDWYRKEANPETIYMETPSMSTENELDLESARTFPSIEISGTAKNIRIYNELTGKIIELDPVIEVSHANYIKMETKPLHRKIVNVDIETGKETNLIEYLTTDSTLDFPLERGVNTIHYRNTYSAPDSKLIFTYTEGWLSCD